MPQYQDFMLACEKHNGFIRDDGACLLKKDGAKVLIRDWRDNSIEHPNHDLHGIFARNDFYFLCYATNIHVDVYGDLNKMKTEDLFDEVYNRWIEAKNNTSTFPSWLVNRKDWRVSIANMGYNFSAKKKICNEEEEIRLTNLANDVFLGNKTVEKVMMDEIMRKGKK
jgi:predicted CopG family antitoxin